MVLGCLHLDSNVDIRGVILSRVNGKRHASVIRQSIEEYTGLTVYGIVPRLPDLPFVQRHLGLIPPAEHHRIHQALEKAEAIARNYLDIPGLLEVARSASSWKVDAFPKPTWDYPIADEPVTIGVIKDTAFQFYYQENIEALTDRGAKVVYINALYEKQLPPVDALYIGGGFPETHAGRLSGNKGFRLSVKEAADAGLPIYAECGGFIYLGESLTIGRSVDYLIISSFILQLADSTEYRFNHHYHTGASPEGIIIHTPVFVTCIIVQVDHVDLNKALFPCPFNN